MKVVFGIQISVLVLISYWWVTYVFPEITREGGGEEVKVYVLDVGQGDAVLIETPNKKRMLVDAGKGLKILNGIHEYIPSHIRTLEMAVLTHPDADHIGGFPYIFERYDIETVLHSFVTKDTTIYRNTMAAVEREGAEVFSIDAPYRFTFDGIEVLVLWPIGQEVRDANAASITLLLRYGETDLLLTGDAPTAVEEKLLELFSEELQDIEILKAGHHGSKTATSEKLLRAITPDIIIYSAGKNNSYGHPHKQVYDRVERYEKESGKTVKEFETKDGTILLCLTKKKVTEC